MINTTSLSCRVATAADADEIAALVNRAYRPAPHERGWTDEADLVAGARTSPEQVLDLFGPQSRILVLSELNRIVACVHLEFGSRVAYIGMLATLPDQQSKGLGKAMLGHAEQYVVEQGLADLFKISVLSSRHALLAFYERRGYAQTGFVEEYPVSAGVGTPLVQGLKLLTLTKTATAAAQSGT